MNVATLNIIYKFCNRLSISIKTRDNILTEVDFKTMLAKFPDSYNICNKLYNNKKSDKILPLLAAPILYDIKLLNNSYDKNTVSDLNDIISMVTNESANIVIDELKSKLSDETIIPNDILTGIYVCCLMINLSMYMKEKKAMKSIYEMNFNESALSGTDDTYNWFSIDNVRSNEDSSIEYDTDLISESIVGFTNNAYSILDKLYKKAIVKYTSMVNNMMLYSSEYDNKLPNVNTISCYPIILGMIYSGSMFE